MKPEEWRAEERDLERLLREVSEPVIVFLSEPFHPGAQVMAERVRGATGLLEGVRLMEVTLGTHRLWARAHAVFGTPTMLVFRRGRVAGRLLGVADPDRVEAVLRSAAADDR